MHFHGTRISISTLIRSGFFHSNLRGFLPSTTISFTCLFFSATTLRNGGNVLVPCYPSVSSTEMSKSTHCMAVTYCITWKNMKKSTKIHSKDSNIHEFSSQGQMYKSFTKILLSVQMNSLLKTMLKSIGYLLGGVGWVTVEYRKMLWGPLRGDS